MINKERELFIKWCNSNGYNTKLSEYFDSNYTFFAYETEQKWIVWQARANLIPDWISVNDNDESVHEKYLIPNENYLIKHKDYEPLKHATWDGTGFSIDDGVNAYGYFLESISHYMPINMPRQRSH